MSILRGLSVVEISSSGAAAWAGKHLADWGAKVTILEPADGSPLRNEPPYYQKEGVQKSALWAWLSRGKTAVRVGEGTKITVDDAIDLCGRADALLIESEMTAPVLGLKPAEVKPRFQGKTTCILISPFATDGPYADYVATDLGINALAGWMSMLGNPTREPLRPGGGMNPRVSGQFALIATLVGLRHVRQGGDPQFIDVSSQAAAASVFTAQWLAKSLNGTRQVRRGSGWPGGVTECADGFVGCSPLTDAHWESMCRMLGLEDVLAQPGGRALPYAHEHGNELYPRVQPWFRERTRAEIVALAQSLRVPAAPVQTVAERLACPQLAARRFWTAADIDGKSVKVPRVSYLIGGAKPVQGKAAQEAETVDLAAPPAATSPHKAPALPFADIRVLDLTHFWAGPYATMILGALGADVIKVESVQRPDLFRYTTAPLSMDRGYEWGALWNDSNCDKRGITLNLASEQGKELFERLVPQADIVISNFSRRVMPNLGLDSGRLLSLNPRLIVVTMPPYGPGGPWEDFVSFGVAAEQLTGSAWMTGYPDGVPVTPGGICDVSVAMHTVVAIELALRYREQTGKGTEVEIPQCEVFDSLFAPEHIAVQFGAPVPTRRGNQHEWMAPHNAYRVAGEDEWITIAVSSDEEFGRLAKALGSPELAGDARFATVASRKHNESVLDSVISAAVKDKDPVTLEQELQAVGVKACRVVKAFNVDEDEGLRHVNFIQYLTRGVTGTHPYKTWPFRFSSIDASHKLPPPLLGQHNAEVLTGLLGLTQKDVMCLEREMVIGSKPLWSID